MPIKFKNILLVEDTDSVRNVLLRQLNILGASVTAVPSAEIAIAFALEQQFELIITDLRMPNADGWAVINGIRKIVGYEQTPIVLITADQVDPSKLPDDFCFYIQKPIYMNTLGEIINGKLDNINPITPVVIDDFAINKDALRVQMGVLNDDAIAMVKLFPQMMRPLVDKILCSSIECNYEQLKESAHSLKGAALSVGALTLANVCWAVQENAAQNMVDKGQIDNLCAEFIKVEKEIILLEPVNKLDIIYS